MLKTLKRIQGISVWDEFNSVDKSVFVGFIDIDSIKLSGKKSNLIGVVSLSFLKTASLSLLIFLFEALLIFFMEPESSYKKMLTLVALSSVDTLPSFWELFASEFLEIIDARTVNKIKY